MNSINRSWELFKSSWAVLRSNPELAGFPAIGAVISLIVSIVYFVIVGILVAIVPGNFGLAESSSRFNNDEVSSGAWVAGVLILFFYYLLMSIVSTYTGVAVVRSAFEYFDRRDPSVGDGIRRANQRISTIVGFSAANATVGVVLSAIRGDNDRGIVGSILGSIVAGVLGAAWNIVTFLVVPVIAAEELGTIETIKQSFNLLRRTWGEQIVGSLGFGLIIGLPVFGIMMLGAFLGVGAITADQIALGIIIFVVTALAVAVLSIISATLMSIFKAALYRYAVTGEIPGGFSPDLVQGAFKQKRGAPRGAF